MKIKMADRPTDRDTLVRHVAADIIYREGVRRKDYPKARERAARLVAASPELREVASAYVRGEVVTRELGEAIKSAER